MNKKKNGLSMFVYFVLLMLGAAVTMSAYAIASDMEGVWEILFAFAFFAIVFFVSLIVHEAGHLLFGLCCGYKFVSFRVMSFMWVRRPEGLKLCRYKLAGTGGQCIMVPPDMVNGKFPTRLYNLGGGLLNLIFAFVCLILCWVFLENDALFAVFLAFAGMNIATGLQNLIPLNMQVPNDGHNALHLEKDPEALRSFWVQLKINEWSTMGSRMRDMPKEWFALPSEEGMQNPITSSVAVFACQRLLDEGRYDEAYAEAKKLVFGDRNVLVLYKALLRMDMICLELIGEGRREEVDRLYNAEVEQLMKSMKSFPTVLRTQCIYALLYEQDAEKAKKYKAAYEKTAEKYPAPAELKSDYELMVKAGEKVNAQCTMQNER